MKLRFYLAILFSAAFFSASSQLSYSQKEKSIVVNADRAILRGFLVDDNGVCLDDSTKTAEIQIFYNETTYNLGAGAIVSFDDRNAEPIYVYFTPKPLTFIEEDENNLFLTPIYVFLNTSEDFIAVGIEKDTTSESVCGNPIVCIKKGETTYSFLIFKCNFIRTYSPSDEEYNQLQEFVDWECYPSLYDYKDNPLILFIKQMYQSSDKIN